MPNVGDPRELIRLAMDLEHAGWDGFFVWDHVQIVAGMAFEVHDPWMVLAGAAHATDRITLGTLVTTPARRRPWILAKQIVTLDHISAGRAVVGVGLGYPEADEFGAFADPTDIVERAERTDEALTIIDHVLRGEPVHHTGTYFDVKAELHPASIQRPRPKLWAAATPPYRKPLERARRWDGVVCNVKVDGDLLPLRPDELRSYVGDLLDDPGRDVVSNRHPDHEPYEYEILGVDWLIDSAWPEDQWLASLRTAISLGP